MLSMTIDHNKDNRYNEGSVANDVWPLHMEWAFIGLVIASQGS